MLSGRIVAALRAVLRHAPDVDPLQIRFGGPGQKASVCGKSRSVARAVPGFLRGIPLNNTAHVRAYGGDGMELAVERPMHGASAPFVLDDRPAARGDLLRFRWGCETVFDEVQRKVNVLGKVFPGSHEGLSVWIKKLRVRILSAENQVGKEDSSEGAQRHPGPRIPGSYKRAFADLANVGNAVRRFDHLSRPPTAHGGGGKLFVEQSLQFLKWLLGVRQLAGLMVLASQNQRAAIGCPVKSMVVIRIVCVPIQGLRRLRNPGFDDIRGIERELCLEERGGQMAPFTARGSVSGDDNLPVTDPTALDHKHVLFLVQPAAGCLFEHVAALPWDRRNQALEIPKRMELALIGKADRRTVKDRICGKKGSAEAKLLRQGRLFLKCGDLAFGLLPERSGQKSGNFAQVAIDPFFPDMGFDSSHPKPGRLPEGPRQWPPVTGHKFAQACVGDKCHVGRRVTGFAAADASLVNKCNGHSRAAKPVGGGNAGNAAADDENIHRDVPVRHRKMHGRRGIQPERGFASGHGPIRNRPAAAVRMDPRRPPGLAATNPAYARQIPETTEGRRSRPRHQTRRPEEGPTERCIKRNAGVDDRTRAARSCQDPPGQIACLKEDQAVRAIWKGAISFGLVNIPIGLYPAVRREELKFHLLRKSDLSPVNYRRVAAADGKEVPWEEIVKGYEYEKEKYVVLKEEDFARVDVEATQTVDIQHFVRLDEVSPLLFHKPYYMEASKGGDRAYVLLRDALRESGKIAIAKVVIRTRQHLAAVKPQDDKLVLELMHFPDELIEAGEFKTPEARAPAKPELKMALQLIESMSEPWKPEQYQDDYREAVQKMIDEKIEAGGRKAPASKGRPSPGKVIDLVAALQRSIEETSTRKPKPSKKRPPRRKAA